MKVYSVIEDDNGKQLWFQDGVHVETPCPPETRSDVMLIDHKTGKVYASNTAHDEPGDDPSR